MKDDLDGAWAVRPLKIIREGDRTMLMFKDTRSEPLDGLLGAIEVRSFLRLANAVTAALAQVRRRGSTRRSSRNILSRIVLAYQSYRLLV